MNWRNRKATKGMYIDSHEHEDIIEYWTGFLAHVKEYSKLMMTYDWDRNDLTHPTVVDLAGGILPLIEITQDKSTFTIYDLHNNKWDHADAKQPEEKNKRNLFMILGTRMG